MNQIVDTESTGSNKFTLALPEDVFADIVVNFLGNKESISYNKNTYFIINLNSLKQFNTLLHEKIAKEQTTYISFFKTSIYYDDDTSRHINTIENLDNFFEVKSVVPMSVTMTWKVVLSFPNAKTIETQTINLTFNITDKTIDGDIILNIEHTNQSWGTEVQNLFINQIKKYTVEPKRELKSIIKKIENFIPKFFTLGLIVLMGLYMANGIRSVSPNKVPTDRVVITESISNKNMSSSDLILTLNAIHNFSDESLKKYSNKEVRDLKLKKVIDSYLQKKIENKYKKVKMFSVIALLIIMFALFIKYYLHQYIRYFKEKSFILLTDEATKSYELFKDSSNKTVFYSLSAVLFAVITVLITAGITELISSSF